jgi:hypothetical protein
MSEETNAQAVNVELGWNPGHNLWVIALTVTLATPHRGEVKVRGADG